MSNTRKQYDSDEKDRYRAYVRTRYGPKREEVIELAENTLGELLRVDSSQFHHWMEQLSTILQEYTEQRTTKGEAFARLADLQFAAITYTPEEV